MRHNQNNLPGDRRRPFIPNVVIACAGAPWGGVVYSWPKVVPLCTVPIAGEQRSQRKQSQMSGRFPVCSN
jgi:hypothetical protein